MIGINILFPAMALSCDSFRNNEARPQLHALAYNLGNFLRTLGLCTVKSGNLFEPRAGAIPRAGRSVILVFHECCQTAMENRHAQRPG